MQLEKLVDESLYEWKTGEQLPYTVNTRVSILNILQSSLSWA